jgi:hypothetical protein
MNQSDGSMNQTQIYESKRGVYESKEHSYEPNAISIKKRQAIALSGVPLLSLYAKSPN